MQKSCQHPGPLQGLGSVNNKQNSLVDLASDIISPYYMKMKDESKKDKNA